MTRDREATTLEQVLRACRGYVMDQWRRDRDDHHCPLVDSIDAQIANLSRAAEPVGYVWFADDGAVRMWSRDAKGINRPGAVPVFTHPSEDARDLDAKDANRFRFWCGRTQCDLDHWRREIDAAMAKENGNG